MKKNKFIYSLSAIALACIISFSGVGNSYIQVHATSVGFDRPVWNDDATVWENILQHLKLYSAICGLYTNPSAISYSIQSFYDFMISDGISHDSAHGVFCDCDDETHTSFSGQEHGGGGFVRDGITTDDDGNVTYSDEVSDLFHGYFVNLLNDSCGYWLFKTIKAEQVDVSYFYDNERYENFIETVNNFGILGVYSLRKSADVTFYYIPTNNLYSNKRPEDIRFSDSVIEYYYGGSYSKFRPQILLDNWTAEWPCYLANSSGSYSDISLKQSYALNDLTLATTTCTSPYLYYEDGLQFFSIVSNDGRALKVWYDLDAFKNYSVGVQPYYVTDSFNSYDSSIDNSITMTSHEFSYYYDNSSTIYQNIQNNINNYGGELDEETVQDIVDSAVQEMKDAIANSGNQGGNDSEDSENGGNGIGDLVDGIGKLLDTILSLIGKVMGVVADFTQSILDLFSGFTDFTDGFSNFLSGAFSFIPQEIWNVIQVGLSLMILLAVIKFLRK